MHRYIMPRAHDMRFGPSQTSAPTDRIKDAGARTARVKTSLPAKEWCMHAVARPRHFLCSVGRAYAPLHVFSCCFFLLVLILSWFGYILAASVSVTLGPGLTLILEIKTSCVECVWWWFSGFCVGFIICFLSKRRVFSSSLHVVIRFAFCTSCSITRCSILLEFLVPFKI